MAHITDVLKKPVLTEKSLMLQQAENKYTFDVEITANKTEVKQAVEKMFDVKVESVNIMNVAPKEWVNTLEKQTKEEKLSLN